MKFITRKSWQLKDHHVTDEAVYRSRRDIIKGMGVFGGVAGASLLAPTLGAGVLAADKNRVLSPLDYQKDAGNLGEALTPKAAVTGYNNFYEFGTSKSDPAANAWRLKPNPWSVQISGLCDKPGDYGLEDVIDFKKLEERIYRLRCVEGWSMVIPWIGVPLMDVLKKFGPKSDAKWVKFETLADKKQMPGVRWPVLDWPYTEGLRMDEAMHPLTLIAVGLYGKELPSQNGAPLRLVVPWKYGFKSIKSIVRIHFTNNQPTSSWQKSIPSEYGFYSNVNPAVDHPRWSQASERRIGEFGRRRTLMFNGYADEVASLYAGMDLRKYY